MLMKQSVIWDYKSKITYYEQLEGITRHSSVVSFIVLTKAKINEKENKKYE